MLAEAPPAKANLETQLRRAIGLANREYLVVLQKARAQSSEVPVWMPDVAQTELRLRGGLNSATPDDLIETVVDALRFELAALQDGEGAGDLLSPPDAIDRIAFRGNLSVFYHILEHQWLACLLHGWTVEASPSVPIQISPSNWEEAVNWGVGQYREDMLNMELVSGSYHFLRHDGLASRRLPRKGISRSGEGKHRLYAVREASPELSDELNVYRMVAAEPDLEPFALRPLPNLDGLTAVNILDVCTALFVLVETRPNAGREETEIHHPEQLVHLAPIEETARVIAALERCTKLSREKCAVALRTLSWRGVRDSLWTRPLVSLRDGTHFAIVWPALKAQNLRRSIEYWLAQGGSDLGERGGEFEEHIRKELADAISQNPLISRCAGVARERVEPPDSAVGDIDLLLWIEQVVLVGEVKCLLRPGTAHERYQFDERLREAAQQAARKAAFVRNNPEWLSAVCPEAARSGPKDFKVIPCVVINSAVGALRSIEGVAVVDRYVLELYFGKGSTRMQASVEDQNSGFRMDFYTGSADAADGLAPFLSNPSHIRVYRESAIRKVSQQPDFVRRSGVVISAYPAIHVPSPAEREETLPAEGGG
jgi:hypothetical protein